MHGKHFGTNLGIGSCTRSLSRGISCAVCIGLGTYRYVVDRFQGTVRTAPLHYLAANGAANGTCTDSSNFPASCIVSPSKMSCHLGTSLNFSFANWRGTTARPRKSLSEGLCMASDFKKSLPTDFLSYEQPSRLWQRQTRSHSQLAALSFLARDRGHAVSSLAKICAQTPTFGTCEISGALLPSEYSNTMQCQQLRTKGRGPARKECFFLHYRRALLAANCHRKVRI